jgi:hypothetical protein
MADLLAIARAKQAKLLKELEKVNAFIEDAEEMEREAGATLAIPGNGADTNGHGEALSNRQIVLNKCREIIGRRGPTPLRDLYGELRKAGVNPGSAKPKGMLSIMLSRSDDFETSENGWTLVR